MKADWVVVVDLAPKGATNRVNRALRDLGFTEVMPFVFISRFGLLDEGRLRSAIRRARKGAVGNVLACPVASGEPFRW